MKKSSMLLLAQAIELGQKALTAHDELQRWRKEPLEDIERTKLSVQLQSALSDQREILDVILDENEADA